MKIVKQRAELYGDPGPNFERTAALWSAYLGHDISPHDVAMCMVLIKVSRCKAGDNADNYLDIQGYASIAQDLR